MSTPPDHLPDPARGRLLVAAVIAMALAFATLGGALAVVAIHVHSRLTAQRPSLSSAVNGTDSATIAAKVDPAVAYVSTTLAGQAGEAYGTGMVLTASGDVLTNNHVIADAAAIHVQLAGTGPIFAATVVGYDVRDDVAVLHIAGASRLPAVKLGDSSNVRPGDTVVAIGDARGLPGPPAVTQGTVSAVNQTVTAGDPGGAAETLSGLIQMDAPIQPGDSGGPLVNTTGRVIGMNTAAAGRRRYSGSSVGFAIPINVAVSIAGQIESGRSTARVHVGARALLGVAIRNGAPNGAFVAAVSPRGPAVRAGMAAGDIIVSLGGQAITSAADLRTALDPHRPGDTIDVQWTDRNGRHHRATVRLTAGPPA